MTIEGPDVSSFQDGLDLFRCTFASFVIAKTTEGVGYTDANYQGWRRQSAALGKLFAWYHFLSGADAAAQVQHTVANVGDISLPGMLDFEPTPTFRPTLAQALAYIDAAHAAGLKLKLLYLPRWYWEEIGSPDLSGLSARGVYLVASSYLGGTGTPSQLYPGDSAAGWSPYGNAKPLVLQFTDRATDGGMPLDYNAFRGSIQQLAAFLGTASPAPVPTPPGDDMALTDTVPVSAGFAARYPATAPDGFTSGAQISVATLLMGAAIRAANNEHLLAAQADQITALRSELDAVKAGMVTPAPVSVSAADLAAAMAGLALTVAPR
jgi:Glycosyl hydrolases family 25